MTTTSITFPPPFQVTLTQTFIYPTGTLLNHLVNVSDITGRLLRIWIVDSMTVDTMEYSCPSIKPRHIHTVEAVGANSVVYQQLITLFCKKVIIIIF